MSEGRQDDSRGQSRHQVAVVGSGNATDEIAAIAEEVGFALGRAGVVLVCGGLGGVMESACKGAKRAGGTTVGIIPGQDRTLANDYVDVVVATGIGEARNAIVVSSADGVMAVGGEYGTLSEIALALRAGKPVVGIKTWELQRPAGIRGVAVEVVPGIVAAEDAEEAVATVLRLINEMREEGQAERR
jgi:uncharacterized protein (TIGR00725 family)